MVMWAEDMGDDTGRLRAGRTLYYPLATDLYYWQFFRPRSSYSQSICFKGMESRRYLAQPGEGNGVE